MKRTFLAFLLIGLALVAGLLMTSRPLVGLDTVRQRAAGHQQAGDQRQADKGENKECSLHRHVLRKLQGQIQRVNDLLGLRQHVVACRQ